jgi:hypothetical protein
MDGIVSDWTMKMSGTITFSDGAVIPIEKNMTLIEFTDLGGGAYEYICCQAEYVKTKDTLKQAVAAALGLNANDIKEVAARPDFTGYTYEEWLEFGRWCWFVPGDDDLRADWGLRSEEEYEKLEVFWRTNGWAKWALLNSSQVSKQTVYNKAKVTFTGSNRMDVIEIVKVPDESEPWNYTGAFSTLEEARAGTVEKHEWHDDGSGGKTMGDLNVMTITR